MQAVIPSIMLIFMLANTDTPFLLWAIKYTVISNIINILQQVFQINDKSTTREALDIFVTTIKCSTATILQYTAAIHNSKK